MAVSACPDDPGKPDYELAKSLYLSGLSLVEIAKQIGVSLAAIRRKATRAGWTQVKSQAVAIIKEKGESELSHKVKDGIAVELVNDLDVIKSKPAKSLAGVIVRQQALSTMAGTAKTIFGWGDTGSTTFNFNLLDSMKLAKADQSQPINVEQVSDLTKQSNSTDSIDSSNSTP